MRSICFLALTLAFIFPAYAEKNSCSSTVNGYRILDKTVFQFSIDKKNCCFFAFYTKNPFPNIGADGNGNDGDSVWFGYYDTDKPTNIYELPKPSSDDWGGMCSVDAVSFYDMNGDKKPDITVIGSCKRNAINYTIPFVFIRKGNGFVFNRKVYSDIYGVIGLTVSDVRKYIKTNGANYGELKDRYMK